jgi:hypothetical protein
VALGNPGPVVGFLHAWLLWWGHPADGEGLPGVGGDGAGCRTLTIIILGDDQFYEPNRPRGLAAI